MENKYNAAKNFDQYGLTMKHRERLKALDLGQVIGLMAHSQLEPVSVFRASFKFHAVEENVMFKAQLRLNADRINTFVGIIYNSNNSDDYDSILDMNLIPQDYNDWLTFANRADAEAYAYGL